MTIDTGTPDIETREVEAADGRSKRGRMSRGMAIELFAIPILVVVGFLLYVWWRQTATLDSIESSSLAWADVRLQLWQHVKLTIVASLIVVAIAVPLGILLTRPGVKVLAPVVVGVANAGQAAPSIGLIVLLFMWLSSWSGFWVAIAALTLYGVLPVLRNTITGLQGVDPTLMEAGRGVGMSNTAVLFRVELPLALPVIMAGIRTALVLVVGTAALATFVNAGGLGGVITAGITLYRYPVMVAGAVLIALLALLVEWFGRVLELLVRPKGI
ncbi:permease [Flexivirga endophytica]|uniref:Permease n=1 Tax=Flexivirga endophytica TaxID=1849103 RepID=A0A916SVN2_9MICO|nr:ABC transporter permease [Flexivirga endophytica]GGB18648.1 permease [Flexivirga endophytica]GHB37023.1 permease [Flexivirga endophytica]